MTTTTAAPETATPTEETPETEPSTTPMPEKPSPSQTRRGRVRRVLLGDPSEENKADALAKSHLAYLAKKEKARTEREAKKAQAAKGRTLIDVVPIPAVAVLLRCAVLFADYMLATMIAMVLIPTLGAWLHEQSGLGLGSTSDAGFIAMWVGPFTFAVLLLTIGTALAMRGMWRSATKVIESLRSRKAARLVAAEVATRAEAKDEDADPAAETEEPKKKPTTETPSTHRRKTKRSKR